MILRITDGTTTINLNGGTNSFYLSESYAPVAPELSVIEARAQAVRDGGDVTAVTQRNVVETVTLAVAATAFSTVQTALRGLETLLYQAQHRQSTGKGAQVWVEYRAADSGDVYRSELLYGRVEPDPETGSATWIAASALRCTVMWQRRFYWEGARTELALDNTSTPSKATGGVTIYNHDDAGSGHDNYVDIAAGDVSGVLPAPAEISLYNSYNSATRTYDVHIANNIFASPTTLTHILEAENCSYVAGSAAATVNADSSNGYYQTATWAASIETTAFDWNLSAAFLATTKGNRFRVLGRVVGATSNLRARLKILLSLTTIAETAEVDVADGLVDFGIVQLPPYLTGETDLYALTFRLSGRCAGGATFILDYLQFTPLDSYRVLVPRGYGVAYTTTLVDNGITGALYVDCAGSGKTGLYIAHGSPVMLWPSVAQRLYFLCKNSSGAPDIVRTHTVRVYYRPRLLTI
ncbi:MAG: hypothetical protein JXR84_22310 [Anaerolineae bacterium]|nr:hypothetical protein [Anaerolineae bacterium]